MSDDPRWWLQQAAAHERSGRLDQAIASYEQLLARWPELPNSWYNLALAQRRAARYDAALASYQQALDRGISEPEEVHLNRGVIHSDFLRQPDEAEREWRTALTLNPSYLPAWLNLANLHEDRGRRDEALQAYERLLALDPAHHEALARYATLKGADGVAAPIIGTLRSAIASPSTPNAARASLGFALGQLLDRCAAHDEAFAAFSAANAASRASASPAGQPLYVRAAVQRLVDELIATFSTPVAQASSASVPPLFICGMFRSGSTLVEQILAGHPQVKAGGELPFLPNLVRSRLAPYPARVATLGAAEFAALGAQYRELLDAVRGSARQVTDKRPDNYLHIGLIKTLFPDAKIVHTHRHPLDNALSIYFLHLDPSLGYALDLEDIAHHYAQYRRLMAHWKALYPGDILDVDYDALVQEPRPIVARLLEFCGLPWDEGCLSFHEVANAVRTASVWQVRQPLYRHASGRWRHYERHLDALREALQPWLQGDAPTAAQPP